MPQIWEREFPPNTCPGWPWQPKEPDSFYTGATLSYVGDPAILQADVYHARWQRVTLPPRVAAGERFVADVALGNRSEVTWPNRGAARVRLAYHWLDATGATVVREGERTELPQPVDPRTRVHVEQKIVAPAQPGRYTLVLEPLLETVSWFGDKDPGTVWRGAVEVGTPGAAAAASPEAATPEAH